MSAIPHMGGMSGAEDSKSNISLVTWKPGSKKNQKTKKTKQKNPNQQNKRRQDGLVGQGTCHQDWPLREQWGLYLPTHKQNQGFSVHICKLSI